MLWGATFVCALYCPFSILILSFICAYIDQLSLL